MYLFLNKFRNYLQLMMLDDRSELPVYRVISLWLENKENNEINSIVDQEFKKNPTYKFIMVLPQLVAHLSFTHEHKFHTALENLLSITYLIETFLFTLI